ncbi:MAG: hypothetical protein IJW10_04325 [Clostridia bacterium]|nr:hypothetical protein [Clostridia bacterium]
MKRTLIRTLSALLCVFILLSCLVSCKAKPIYELGPYSISEMDYKYLIGMHNRQVLESMGLFGYSYDAIDESTGVSIGDSLDQGYTASFTASVISLLYSQLMFDKYNLSIDDETSKLIDDNITAIIASCGAGSEQEFDFLAKKYGFNTDTLRKIYTMQMKQSLLIEHLYGKNGEKIDQAILDSIYRENYMYFQTIVINNLYRVVEKEVDGKKVTTVEELSADEKKRRNDIIDDLNNLLVSPKDGYTYKVIDPTMSYEELYALYSDDTAYPQGCYSKFPTVLTAQNAITAAALIREGDTTKIVAKRPFTQDTIINGEKVSAGDYVNYGYVFVKRMPLGEAPYTKDEYKTFFSSFFNDAKNELFGKAIQDYILNDANFELVESDEIKDYPLSSVPANNLDYNYFSKLNSSK